MDFAADCHFHIGQMHLNSGKPCQDYALSGLHGDSAYVVVSDGCSSGGRTDVGSRVLTLATVAAIKEQWASSGLILGDTVSMEIKTRQKVAMSTIRDLLGLDWNDMLATCVYVHLTPKGCLVNVQGDGVVALRNRNGHITMSRYEWSDSRPFYPAYLGDDYKSFVDAHGGDLNDVRLTRETWEYIPESDEYIEIEKDGLALREGIQGIATSLTAEELENYDAIAIFSDGIVQIEGMDWRDAVVRSLAFKTTAGEFVKRRMIRIIKDSKKNGRGPLDDISCAVIRIVSEEGV